MAKDMEVSKRKADDEKKKTERALGLAQLQAATAMMQSASSARDDSGTCTSPCCTVVRFVRTSRPPLSCIRV